MRRHLVLAISLCFMLALLLPASAQQDAEPTQTAEAVNLVVWWPDALAPLGDSEVDETIADLIAEFEATETDVTITFRRKTLNDPGGIMPTLRTGSAIAPGALPDVTILRREEMILAEQLGLIRPLEGLIPASIIADLGQVLPLGQVDNELYGLPLLLNMRHLVYRSSDTPLVQWSFDDVLALGEPLAFPANRATGISDMFFAQYLDAGGAVSLSGELVFNEEALLTVLTFYEQARENGLISDAVQGYSSMADYLPLLSDGSLNVAVVDTTTYLQLASQSPDLRVASLPVASGQPTAILGGWMWAMVTRDEARQALVSRFITFMSQPEQQVRYANAIQRMPARPAALRDWVTQDARYNNLVTLLDHTVLPLPESSGGALVRVLQNALMQVLSGQKTAEEAVAEVATQVGQ